MKATVYRVSKATGLLTRLALVLFAVTSLLLLVLPTGSFFSQRLPAALTAASGAVAMYCFGVRPRLEIDDREVRVYGPLSTTRFPLDDLSYASGRARLILHRRSGDRVAVVAVSNTNISLARRRPGRVGRVGRVAGS